MYKHLYLSATSEKQVWVCQVLFDDFERQQSQQCFYLSNMFSNVWLGVNFYDIRPEILCHDYSAYICGWILHNEWAYGGMCKERKLTVRYVGSL